MAIALLGRDVEFVAKKSDFKWFLPLRRNRNLSISQQHHALCVELLGCSQAVRQRFLVACTVGSNPTTPATLFSNFIFYKSDLQETTLETTRDVISLPYLSLALKVMISQVQRVKFHDKGLINNLTLSRAHSRVGFFNAHDAGWEQKMISRSIIIGLLSFLTLIDLFGSQAILPRLTQLFDTDPASMGLAVNASTLGMAAAGLAVALFSRKIDRIKGIWISLALLAIPTALLGVIDDLTYFTWARIAQGALMATAFTLTMSYLAEECSVAEAAGAMAAYITGNVLSNLVGRLMAANFADWFGVPVSFWLFAVLNLSGALLAYFCLSQTKQRQADANAPSVMAVWKVHLTNPRLQASFLLGFIILFVFLAVFTYVNFVLSAAPFSLTGQQLGLVYFVFLPAVFTTPLAGMMSKKRGIYFAFCMSMGLASLGLLALLSNQLIVVILGLSMVGVGTFCGQAVVSGQIGAAATADRAAASGLYLTSYYLGGLLGAAIIGRIFTASGWASAVYVLLAVTLASLLIARLLKRPASPSAT